MPIKSLRRIYFAIYQSRLQFGLVHWGSTYAKYIHRLEVLQNFALLIMFRQRRDISARPYYLQAEILPLCLLYVRNVILFTLKYFVQVKELVYARTSRQSERGLFVIPFFRLQHSCNTLCYQRFKLTNDLLTTSDAFCKLVKGVREENRSLNGVCKFVKEIFKKKKLAARADPD